MRLITAVLMLVASPLLAQDPVDARGWLNRGVSEFKAARYPEAVAAFQRAVQSDPSFVTARLYLGTAWMQQYIPGAQTPENQAMAAAADQEFRGVLEMDPGNQTAMAYLASLSLNQKNWDDAQAWYEKLVAVDPNNATAWYSMGFIAWSRWYPAIMEARRDLGMKLQDPGPLTSPAVKAELKAKYGPVLEGGLRALQQALSIDPMYDDAMAYMNLLIRERADLLDTAEEYRRDVAVANDWVDKAMETKKQKMNLRGGLGTVAPQPPPPPQPGKGAGIAQSRANTAQPITRVEPVYPADAKRAGRQGSVQLSVVIGKNGRVLQASYLSGEPAFAEAAIAAVRQWVYQPTLLNGEPVEWTVQVELNFKLN